MSATGEIKVEDLMQSMRSRASLEPLGDSGDSVSRSQSSMAVIARAQDQLPPITTRRTGLLSGIELWLKRQLKRTTHWYTWEQVNFNAAVNRALNETFVTLQTLERQLREVRVHVDANAATVGDCNSRLKSLESSFTSLENRIASLAEKWEGSRIEQLENFELLLNEQRVCLKQLTLEIRETARISDALRQMFESRLAELAARINERTGSQPKRLAVEVAEPPSRTLP